MRVSCVLLTHTRAKVEMRRHPHLKDSPVIIVDRDPSATRSLVVDRFPAASGAAAGMTIQQAMSRHANAVVLDADEPSLLLGIQADTRVSPGHQRPGRGGRAGHRLRATGWPGGTVPRRSWSRLSPADCSSRIPEPPRRCS